MILADSYDAFLLDLDGVVWRGEIGLPRAAETVAALRERGKRVVFVTNNSSRTPRDYAVKLFRMKVPTETQDIITSGHAVAAELRRLGLEVGDRVHVCGGEGLVRLLTHERFIPTTDVTDVQAVVVGWNPKGTFEDIRRAATLARSGAPLVASNADPTFPGEHELLPGTGAILAAIEVASGVEATIVGKPKPELFRLALQRAGAPAERTLFCGDRATTDIVGARAAGIPCALVLTGVTTEGELSSMEVLPDEILDDLSDLLRDLPSPPVPDGIEVARLDAERNGGSVTLRGFSVPANVERRAAWLVLRRLLVEAVAGAESIDAAGEVRPYLERIGVDASPQPRLFRE